MFKIIGARGIGKTKKLIEKASMSDGLIVCKDPTSMLEKIHEYGYSRIQVVSYKDYKEYFKNKTENEINYSDKPVFIDELSCFMKYLDNNLKGYTDCVEFKIEY